MNEVQVHELNKDVRVMMQGEFTVPPQTALEQIRAIQSVFKDVMQKDEHYGVIPGTTKPTLLKPGAELLNNMYGFYLDDVELVEKSEEWSVRVTPETFPLFRYLVKTRLKNRDGITISTGIGECNSYEDKYRFRSQNRVCPTCGKETIIKGKAEYGGGFLCFQKKGGCGAKFKDTDQAITSQVDGKVHNEKIFDQVNTILKIAKKRSYVDATLSATRTSGVFTQDMEDFARLPEQAAEDASFTDLTNKESVHPPQQPAQSQQVKVTDNISVGKEFDPQNECIKGGKYVGTMYSDVPQDYLEWASKNMKGEAKTKAEATLKWLSQRGGMVEGSTAYQPNVVNEMFPENSAPKESKFDALCTSLTAAANKKDVFSLDIWITENKADLALLPENEKDILRKSWTNAKNELTPKATKKASK